MLDTPRLPFLGDCIDATYRAASNAQDWRSLLALFGDMFPGTKWAIASEQPQARRNIGFLWHGFDDRVISDYVAHYAAVNPWVPHAATIPVLKAAVSDIYYPSRLFRNHEFYAGFIEAAGEAESATGIKLFQDAHRFAVLSVHYGTRMAETYNQTLPRFLDALAPHLRNAVEINARLHHAGSIGQTVAAVISQFAAPAFLLDDRGRLHTANQAGHALLDARFNVSLDRGGRLRLGDCAAAQRLERCLSSTDQKEIDQLVAPFVVADPWRFIDLPFDSPDLPLAWLPARGRWILAVFEPSSADEAADAGLGSGYGLTPRQRATARALVDGLSLSQAADQMGVSVNTMRQHLKALFAKTGTHRQAELVARLTKDVRRAS